MGLSRLEQETVITLNASEPTAHITTYMGRWVRHLKRHPLFVEEDGGTFEGTAWVSGAIPKKLISLPRQERKPREMSEEEREAAGKRLAEGREKKAA